MDRCYPYGHQSIGRGDISEVVKALKSDFITQGPAISKFEDALCSYTGAKYAVAVSSGTAALHLACLTAGIGKGDKVITSPLTFLASANCILYCKGRPVFADVQPSTGCLDINSLLNNISSGVKAVIPVHFGGHPCDLSAIHKIARKHGIFVIEDAAHAIGSRFNGSKIGSCKYSDMTIFSFHPVKTITTGEGGAILTNNKNLYQTLMMLRTHGITKDRLRWIRKGMGDCPWYYEMQELGFNYRISDIHAALGLSQIKKLDDFVHKRRNIALIYSSAFKSIPYFDIPAEESYSYSSYHLYPIRIKDRFVKVKHTIFNMLHKKGIGAQVHYIPVYLQPYYMRMGFAPGLCPQSEIFYNKEISIPIYPGLKKQDVFHVIDVITEVFKRVESC